MNEEKEVIGGICIILLVLWLVVIPTLVTLLLPLEWQVAYSERASNLLFGGGLPTGLAPGTGGIVGEIFGLCVLHGIMAILALVVLIALSVVLFAAYCVLLVVAGIGPSIINVFGFVMRQPKFLLATGLLLSVLGATAIDIRSVAPAPGTMLLIGQFLGLAVASAFLLLRQRLAPATPPAS